MTRTIQRLKSPNGISFSFSFTVVCATDDRMLLAPKMIPRHSAFIVLRVNCFISINFFCLEYVYYDKMAFKFYARNMPVLIIVLNNVNNVVNAFILAAK